MTIQPINLRPLKAGEILDRAFRLYRVHFWRFIGIAGILLGPLLVLALLSQFIFHNTSIVDFIQSLLTVYLLHGALIWAASHAYLGKQATMNDSYRAAQRYSRRFIRVNIRQGLAYISLIIIAVIIIFVFSIAAGGSIGMVLVFLVAIPYAFFFSLRWWFAFPALMLEDLNDSNALKRSWFLTSQNFWHVAVVLIAAGLLAYLLTLLPSILISYALLQFSAINEISTALASAITQLGTIITLPLSISILVIAYYDMRVRLEGYDLELALQSTPETFEITHESV